MSAYTTTVHKNATKVVDYEERNTISFTPAQLLALLQQSEHVEEIFEKVKLSGAFLFPETLELERTQICIDNVPDEIPSKNSQVSPTKSTLDDSRSSSHRTTQLTRTGTLNLLKEYLKSNVVTLPPNRADNEQVSVDLDEYYDDTMVKLLVKAAAAVEANRSSLRRYDPRGSSGRGRVSSQHYLEENAPLHTFLQSSNPSPIIEENKAPMAKHTHQRVRSRTDASDTYRAKALTTGSRRSKNVSFKSQPNFARASTLPTQSSATETSSKATNCMADETLFTEELTSEPSIIENEGADDCEKFTNEKATHLWSHIFQELIETERQYVQVLRSLLQCFIIRLEKLDWVTYGQKRDISRNVHELVTFQDTFLQSLESTYQKGWNGSGTGPAQCFLMLSCQFRVYIPYCSEQDSAQRVLTELEKRAEWVSFTEECAADIQRESKTTRLPIQSYLMEPIQRICRYPLLLEKFMESTQKDSLAFREVISARNLIRRIAREINEKKRQKEGREKAKILRNRLECAPGLSLEFVHSLGSIVLAGALLVVNYQTQPPKIKYYGCVLFESYFLIIKAKKTTTYEPKHWLPLHKIDIHDFNDDGNAWRISYLSKPILEFQATCEKEKRLWFQTLSKLISKSKRARHQANQSPTSDRSPSSLLLCFRTEQNVILSRAKTCSQLESTLMREPSNGLNNASRTQSLRTTIDIKLSDLFTQECIASRTIEHTSMLRLGTNQTKRSVSAGAIIKPRNISNRRKTWGHTNSAADSPVDGFDAPKLNNSFSIIKMEENRHSSTKDQAINTFCVPHENICSRSLINSQQSLCEQEEELLQPNILYTKKETEGAKPENQDQFAVEHEFSLSRITVARSLQLRKIFWRGKMNGEPNSKDNVWKSPTSHIEESLSDNSLHIYKDHSADKMRGNFFGRMSEKLKSKQRTVNSVSDLRNRILTTHSNATCLTSQTSCAKDTNYVYGETSKLLASYTSK